MSKHKFLIGDLVRCTSFDADLNTLVGTCVGYSYATWRADPAKSISSQIILYKILFSNGYIHNRTGYNLEKLT